MSCCGIHEIWTTRLLERCGILDLLHAVDCVPQDGFEFDIQVGAMFWTILDIAYEIASDFRKAAFIP